jgi:ABC-type spermidine/putrescine transport system permease subunit II
MENSNYDEENGYYKAKRQVDELRKFYTSLISYFFVIPLLIFINLRFNSRFQWFWFPAFGWGLGLTMKGLRVFGYGTNWEERKIQQILSKEENKQNWK